MDIPKFSTGQIILIFSAVLALIVVIVYSIASREIVTHNGKTVLETVSPFRENYPESRDEFEPHDSRKVPPADSPVTPAILDSVIQSVMETDHIPGLSACLIRGDRVLWTGTYGYANIRRKIEVSDSTLFMLASVSKTVTGTALLQLWENGLFDLEADINDYLPFPVTNPHCPEAAITFRTLLSHTSSLNDNWNVMYSTYVRGDTPIPLDEYVSMYFHPEGCFYDAEKNFNPWLPGARHEYCNHNFVLIGYLVERISGIPFDRYCRDFIFAPLGMNETSWFLADVNVEYVAMPYGYENGRHVEYGHFGYADYPAGTLRTSALQLARFLAMFIQGGFLEKARVLQESTVDLMTTLQYPKLSASQGLIWFKSSLANRHVWQHGGGDRGVSTMAAFCPEDSTGIVTLINGNTSLGTSVVPYYLFRLADDRDGDGVFDWQDNCPDIANSDQEDADGDGVGNPCEARPGDVNQDGLVNILDAQAAIGVILGILDFEEGSLPQADCNGDGLLNILDVVSIVNSILGLGTCRP